jgi:hypothetical protein
MFAIEVNDLELVDDIHKKCLNLFSKDLENNKAFLSIIVTSLPLLNERYPEYVARFSLDTNMIIDSRDYRMEHRKYIKHFNTTQLEPFIFSEIEIKKVDLKPQAKNQKTKQGMDQETKQGMNQDMKQEKMKQVINKLFMKSKLTITFMNPYIKFVTYPQGPQGHDSYWWWWLRDLIKPKPSPFVKTINEDVYKTCNGEALIKFKWNKYGFRYYILIWMQFFALLGCFTAAATIPKDGLSDDNRKNLFKATIVLGISFILHELRQLTYDYADWFDDPWNIIGTY